MTSDHRLTPEDEARIVELHVTLWPEELLREIRESNRQLTPDEARELHKADHPLEFVQLKCLDCNRTFAPTRGSRCCRRCTRKREATASPIAPGR